MPIVSHASYLKQETTLQNNSHSFTVHFTAKPILQNL